MVTLRVIHPLAGYFFEFSSNALSILIVNAFSFHYNCMLTFFFININERLDPYMSEKTDGAIIKNGQSRDTGDIRHKTRSEDK